MVTSIIALLAGLFKALPELIKLFKDLNADHKQSKATERLQSKNCAVSAAIARVRGVPNAPAGEQPAANGKA